MADLDTLDRQIIVELRRDGRLTHTEIGRRLGVSEATIRSRFQRLTSDGIIRVAAAVNLSRLGYNIHVIIGVKCEPDQVSTGMKSLTDVTEVRMVSAVSGRWDLLVTASFQTREDLLSFLTERLGRLNGILKSETLHVLREVKRDSYYWEAKPLSSSHSTDATGEEPQPGRADPDLDWLI